MLEFLALVSTNWPTVGLIATLLIGMYLITRHWNSSEMRDMRERVDYLDRQMRALRYRDQVYFEYVLYTEAYHHRVALQAVARGFVLERHQPFVEFRDRWMLEHGLRDEQAEIWEL